jgi:cysteine-rich repeat protein
VQEGEDCDDGNLVLDTVCDATCHFTCGNGVFDSTVGELCETSIASGAGACPTACDDGDACTADVLSGSECSAECLTSPITAAADGDGCCPAGANANTDDDCTAMCGNGILETGEGCDTAITVGAGACPTTCNDGQSCTTDTLMSAGSCQASCTNTAITTPINGDSCCPPGANATNDDDCSASCGNGVREGVETCDTAIAAGMTDACPTTCDDSMACTTNVLSNGGTCTAACSFPAITAPANNDGCCPAGANANNDNDCTPVCPNGVTEGTEQCDDGNMIDTDACSNTCTTNVVATAFRFDTLRLRDPHAYATIFFGCSDITNSAFGNAVNEQFATQMTTDGDNDGNLDLSPTAVFRPLNQGGTLTSPTEIHFADCTAPVSGTMCSPGTDPPILLTATNQTTGTCLGPIAGTINHTAPGTGTYSPAITSSTAPCFATGTSTVTFNLAGVSITLRDARIAATYSGSPATGLVNGLLRGFITETDADATIFPAGTAVVGGKSLSFVLPGGTGNCANHSAKDVHMGVSGWWFYLNFTAPRATWSDN